MVFRILGGLEVAGGTCRIPAPPKVRRVLACLLVRANRVVPVGTLIEELWGARPPRSALATVQTYICQLRRELAHDASGQVRIDTGSGGYVLRIAPGQVDADRFRELVDQAGRAARAGQHESALARLDEALGLWRGPALADLDHGPVLEGYVVHLEEERLRAEELRFDAAFALGLHREQIAPLRSLVRRHPLNEGLHGRLIEALAQSQRRGEALAAYRSLHEILDREIGLVPSEAVQRLQRQLLKAS